MEKKIFETARFAFHEFERNSEGINFFGHCCAAVGEKIFIFGGAIKSKFNTPIHAFNTVDRVIRPILLKNSTIINGKEILPKSFNGGACCAFTSSCAPEILVEYLSSVKKANKYKFNENEITKIFVIVAGKQFLVFENESRVMLEIPQRFGTPPDIACSMCYSESNKMIYILTSDDKKSHCLHIFDFSELRWKKVLFAGDIPPFSPNSRMILDDDTNKVYVLAAVGQSPTTLYEIAIDLQQPNSQSKKVRFRNKGPDYAHFPDEKAWSQQRQDFFGSLFSPYLGNSCFMVMIKIADNQIPEYLGTFGISSQETTKTKKHILIFSNPSCLTHVWSFDIQNSWWRNLTGLIEYNTKYGLQTSSFWQENEKTVNAKDSTTKKGIFASLFGKADKKKKNGIANTIPRLNHPKDFPEDVEAIGGCPIPCQPPPDTSLVLFGGKKNNEGLMPPGFFVFEFSKKTTLPRVKNIPAFVDILLICHDYR